MLSQLIDFVNDCFIPRTFTECFIFLYTRLNVIFTNFQIARISTNLWRKLEDLKMVYHCEAISLTIFMTSSPALSKESNYDLTYSRSGHFQAPLLLSENCYFFDYILCKYSKITRALVILSDLCQLTYWLKLMLKLSQLIDVTYISDFSAYLEFLQGILLKKALNENYYIKRRPEMA